MIVAEELSFSRAAERLHMAQPALTRIVKRLEDRLGGRLFDRDTRNVALTHLGTCLLDDARSVLEGVNTIEKRAGEILGGNNNLIRIGYMNFITHDILGPMLSAFQTSDPRSRVELNYLGTLEQRAALREQELDIAFMIGPFSAPRIASRTMRREDMMLVMHAGHPLASKRLIEPADLTDLPMVLGNVELWSTFREYLFTLFERHGIAPKIVQEVPTPAAIFSLVSAGVGVTLYPRAAKFYYHCDLVLRPLAVEYPKLETICAWNTQNIKPNVARFLNQMSKLGFP